MNGTEPPESQLKERALRAAECDVGPAGRTWIAEHRQIAIVIVRPGHDVQQSLHDAVIVALGGGAERLFDQMVAGNERGVVPAHQILNFGG